MMTVYIDRLADGLIMANGGVGTREDFYGLVFNSYGSELNALALNPAFNFKGLVNNLVNRHLSYVANPLNIPTNSIGNITLPCSF
jgi:hypothetical protein